MGKKRPGGSYSVQSRLPPPLLFPPPPPPSTPPASAAPLPLPALEGVREELSKHSFPTPLMTQVSWRWTAAATTRRSPRLTKLKDKRSWDSPSGPQPRPPPPSPSCTLTLLPPSVSPTTAPPLASTCLPSTASAKQTR